MTATAYTVENKKLKELWAYDSGNSNSSTNTYGDGNHNSMAADVDNDGTLFYEDEWTSGAEEFFKEHLQKRNDIIMGYYSLRLLNAQRIEDAANALKGYEDNKSVKWAFFTIVMKYSALPLEVTKKTPALMGGGMSFVERSGICYRQILHVYPINTSHPVFHWSLSACQPGKFCIMLQKKCCLHLCKLYSMCSCRQSEHHCSYWQYNHC